MVSAIRQGDKIETVRILRIGARAGAFRVDQSLFDRLLHEAPARQRQYAAAARRLALERITELWPGATVTKSGLRYVVEKEGA